MLENTQTSDMQQYMAIAIRLVGGVTNLAQIAGVSERTVYAWKNGERFPSRANLAKVSAHLETVTSPNQTQGSIPFQTAQQQEGLEGASPEPSISLSDSSSGYQTSSQSSNGEYLDSKLHYPTATPLIPSAIYTETWKKWLETSDKNQQHCLIPFLFATNAHQETLAEQFAFSTDWIAQFTGNLRGLRILQISGRSMETTLHDKDYCLVDTNDKAMMDDKIYVLRYQTSIFIKRICTRLDAFLLRSDNRELAYQDFEISHDDFTKAWEVIGRIIWVGKVL